MLARGVICRLAADVPTTSTHQLTRVLQRSILRRNALSLPAIRAVLRAYSVCVRDSRRSYATTTNDTKPTATVKKAVKKTAAKKPAVTKKAVAGKTTKKTAAKKVKAKPKPKKKVAAKPKKTRKVLTPEEKERKVLRDLRNKALREPVTKGTLSAWMVFQSEATATKPRPASGLIRDKYVNLSPAEKEHYNHLANQQTAAKLTKYRAWVHSYTPEQIRVANNARALLRKKLASQKASPAHTVPIEDDRWTLKRPSNSYNLFFKERQASGDLKGISIADGGKLIGNEWKALSSAEKKKYEDQYAVGKAEYIKEWERVFGTKPGEKASKKT